MSKITQNILLASASDQVLVHKLDSSTPIVAIKSRLDVTAIAWSHNSKSIFTLNDHLAQI